MFCIGDKVVYPMHGAGIIKDLQEKDIDGTTQTYYVLNIPIGNLTVTISSLKATDLGVRAACSKEETQKLLDEHYELSENIPENWNDRYKFNIQKIKTGCLKEVIEVYTSLHLREKTKSLSGQEKKLASTAKQIILSELVISQNIEKDLAEDMLRNMIQRYNTAC